MVAERAAVRQRAATQMRTDLFESHKEAFRVLQVSACPFIETLELTHALYDDHTSPTHDDSALRVAYGELLADAAGIGYSVLEYVAAGIIIVEYKLLTACRTGLSVHAARWWNLMRAMRKSERDPTEEHLQDYMPISVACCLLMSIDFRATSDPTGNCNLLERIFGTGGRLALPVNAVQAVVVLASQSSEDFNAYTSTYVKAFPDTTQRIIRVIELAEAQHPAETYRLSLARTPHDWSLDESRNQARSGARFNFRVIQCLADRHASVENWHKRMRNPLFDWNASSDVLVALILMQARELCRLRVRDPHAPVARGFLLRYIMTGAAGASMDWSVRDANEYPADARGVPAERAYYMQRLLRLPLIRGAFATMVCWMNTWIISALYATACCIDNVPSENTTTHLDRFVDMRDQRSVITKASLLALVESLLEHPWWNAPEDRGMNTGLPYVGFEWSDEEGLIQLTRINPYGASCVAQMWRILYGARTSTLLNYTHFTPPRLAVHIARIQAAHPEWSLERRVRAMTAYDATSDTSGDTSYRFADSHLRPECMQSRIDWCDASAYTPLDRERLMLLELHQSEMREEIQVMLDSCKRYVADDVMQARDPVEHEQSRKRHEHADIFRAWLQALCGTREGVERVRRCSAWTDLDVPSEARSSIDEHMLGTLKRIVETYRRADGTLRSRGHRRIAKDCARALRASSLNHIHSRMVEPLVASAYAKLRAQIVECQTVPWWSVEDIFRFVSSGAFAAARTRHLSTDYIAHSDWEPSVERPDFVGSPLPAQPVPEYPVSYDSESASDLDTDDSDA